MKVSARLVIIVFLASCGLSWPAHVRAAATGRSSHVVSNVVRRSNPGRARPTARTSKLSTVAVQPITGEAGPGIRSQVVQIVRNHGYRAMTSLPRYEGTGQYPELARDHHLKAFVTADLDERGTRRSVTFLVWNGLTGSVLGRWSVSGSATSLGRSIGKGFWRNIGPVLAKAVAPPSTTLDEAAPMTIDATSDGADSVASR